MASNSPTAGFDGRTRIDLSHVVEHGMTTYPGLPAPVIGDVLTREASRERYAPGTEFSIGQIALCGNTGTYVDSPFHRYADGADLAALELDRLADLEAVVVDATGNAGRAIGPELLGGHDLARQWRSWSGPTGLDTGGPMRISPGTRSSPRRQPITSSAPEPAWWGLTR